MNTKLHSLPRPARPVTVPGGGTLHVRDLSLAELREIDRRADGVGAELQIRYAVLVCAYALANEDGTPLFPDRSAEDLDAVECLTPAQLGAVAEAALPTKADAKNG
ncbi:unnamed protein product [Gemmataceae bacterium]|nr:unnamed protein product [Gemmataceae bacterium]VTU02775.1 unnamed protein product [Gemmataceae bacterium]